MTPDTYHTHKILMMCYLILTDTWSEVAQHIEKKKWEFRHLLGRNQLSRILGNTQWPLQKRKYGCESRRKRTKAGMGTAGIFGDIA